MTSEGLLFVLSEPGPVPDREFHDWYDTEHGPARLALPGIRNGRRYRAADGGSPAWLATYELDLAVLATPEYRALRERRSARERSVLARLTTLERRVYELVDDHGEATDHAPAVVLCRSMSVPADREAELHAWYVEEHIPLLHRIPGWRRTRRYRLRAAGEPRFLALHELAGTEPLDSAGYRAATHTPWRERVTGAATGHERRLFRLHTVLRPPVLSPPGNRG
jgi:hypothetical protein